MEGRGRLGEGRRSAGKGGEGVGLGEVVGLVWWAEAGCGGLVVVEGGRGGWRAGVEGGVRRVGGARVREGLGGEESGLGNCNQVSLPTSSLKGAKPSDTPKRWCRPSTKGGSPDYL